MPLSQGLYSSWVYILKQECRARLKKTSYLFANEKVLKIWGCTQNYLKSLYLALSISLFYIDLEYAVILQYSK